MNKYVLLLSLSALLSACGEKAAEQAASTPANTSAPAAQAAPATNPAANDKAALVEASKAAIQALGTKLKGELQATMQAGGPAKAMEVCNTKAPEIAKAVSSENGLQISRTSLKVRNPDNAPNEWQSKVLNDFEAQKAAGKDPGTLAYAEIVGNEFRFMKAIPTSAVCLNCHGTDIKPAVTSKLTELYPQDKATGFREGDLRGAFVVVKNLAQ
jgi:hypothetical protein